MSGVNEMKDMCMDEYICACVCVCEWLSLNRCVFYILLIVINVDINKFSRV